MNKQRRRKRSKKQDVTVSHIIEELIKDPENIALVRKDMTCIKFIPNRLKPAPPEVKQFIKEHSK